MINLFVDVIGLKFKVWRLSLLVFVDLSDDVSDDVMYVLCIIMKIIGYFYFILNLVLIFLFFI